MTAQPAVRHELETLLRNRLADSRGYAIAAISFGQAIEVMLQKGGATFAIWLRPLSDDTNHYKSTARFKIGYRGEPFDRLGYALIDDACALLDQWARSLQEDAVAQLFDAPTAAAVPEPEKTLQRVAFEWLAVRSGLKPAGRFVTAVAAADLVVERARVEGLCARKTQAQTVILGSDETKVSVDTIVYVALTERAIAAVEEAEAHFVREGRVTDDWSAMGAALGYPLCCVDAWNGATDRAHPAMRFDALRRTPGSASRFLNDLNERTLVSHLVCRYDCAGSIRYARALFDELERVDPDSARDLDRTLDGLVVRFRRGGALRFVLAAPPSGRTYRFAAVEEFGEGALMEKWRDELRGADRVEVLGDEVRVFRGANEVCRLEAPPDEVQIRLFA